MIKTPRERSALLWIVLSVFCFCFLCTSASQVQAAPTPDIRPDWWGSADARVIFDSIPDMGTWGSGTAGGSGGFGYSYLTMTMSVPEQLLDIMDIDDIDDIQADAILVNLDNQQDDHKTKLFWVAYHLESWELGDPIPLVFITGYFDDGSVQSISPFDFFDDFDFGVTDDWWVYMEAAMFPQPDRETFLVVLSLRLTLDGTELSVFSTDYLEMGTKCVPIPATALLLCSGLVGLVVMRSKRR